MTPGRDRSCGRVVAVWTAAVVVLWLLGGAVAGAVGAGLAGWHLTRPPAPRVVLRAAIGTLGLVPVAWVLGNASRLGTLSPDVVTANPWPGALATAGVTLLVVGTLLDDRTPPATRQDAGPA